MHRIIYLPEFDDQARAIGGIHFVGAALRPVIRYIQTEWFRVRYAITKPHGNFPAFLAYFSIDEDDDVLMEWVEIYVPY